MRSIKTVAFQTGNPGKLALPGFATIFMAVVLGFPAVVLPPMTWDLQPEMPILLPVLWIGACFPLAVLYVLGRLMSRYALRVFSDGSIDIVFPFKTVPIDAGKLASVRQASGGSQRMRQVFVQFVTIDGKVAADVARNAFSTVQWSGFFDALRQAAPQVAVA
jgi:hypothetical protein